MGPLFIYQGRYYTFSHSKVVMRGVKHGAKICDERRV